MKLSPECRDITSNNGKGDLGCFKTASRFSIFKKWARECVGEKYSLGSGRGFFGSFAIEDPLIALCADGAGCDDDQQSSFIFCRSIGGNYGVILHRQTGRPWRIHSDRLEILQRIPSSVHDDLLSINHFFLFFPYILLFDSLIVYIPCQLPKKNDRSCLRQLQ